MSNILESRRDGRVQWLYLNRPDVLNALNSDLLNELRDALEAAAADPEVRVIALTGVGRAFSAGGDLKLVLGELENGVDGPDGVAHSVPAFTALRECPKPVVAAVNGLAVAGGFELLLFCDVLFAAESATFADGHANFGLLPAGGGAAVLPRRIGPQHAKAMLFSGDPVSAATMQNWGMVYQVVPDDELHATVKQYCDKVASKSPLVLQGMKELADAALDQDEDLGLRSEMLRLRNHMTTDDFHEGLTAFAEKRTPDFTGR